MIYYVFLLAYVVSSFSSAPLKILYVDANYLMFYACYSGDSDAPCLNEMMEVTLAGRTLEISDKEKTKIYKILPKICVDPADMIDTVFAGIILFRFLY